MKTFRTKILVNIFNERERRNIFIKLIPYIKFTIQYLIKILIKIKYTKVSVDELMFLGFLNNHWIFEGCRLTRCFWIE